MAHKWTSQDVQVFITNSPWNWPTPLRLFLKFTHTINMIPKIENRCHKLIWSFNHNTIKKFVLCWWMSKYLFAQWNFFFSYGRAYSEDSLLPEILKHTRLNQCLKNGVEIVFNQQWMHLGYKLIISRQTSSFFASLNHQGSTEQALQD